MLYTMSYFMSHLINLTRESAKQAVTKLRSPALPFRSDIPTSQLLNIQLKQQCTKLLGDKLHGVLEHFETPLVRAKCHTYTWASSFRSVYNAIDPFR